jgi:hypothetical protein
MLGAALLEAETYQEVAVAPSLRNQAVLVVAITALAAGLGNLGGGLTGLLLAGLAAMIGWGLFALVAYWVATNRYGVPRTHNNLSATLRVLALASTPRLFLLFTFIPGIGFLVGLAVHTWLLITAVLALETALDMHRRPAIVTAVAGVLPMLLLWALVWLLV